MKSLFTVEDLFKARVHLGHKSGLRNDYMLPYIHGEFFTVYAAYCCAFFMEHAVCMHDILLLSFTIFRGNFSIGFIPL